MPEQVVSAEPLTGSWPAVPDAVAGLRQSVVEYARRVGASEPVLSSIKLAVSEAATNAVLHAYPEGEEPGEVAVCASREADTLCVVVTDDGGGMVPRADSPGLGLGLPLIAQLVDGLEVDTSEGGGTSLCTRFAL